MRFAGFERGMGIGGWLTNYKRFNVLPDKWRLPLTVGDMEHFASYITEADVAYIASLGMDHIRLGFDQIVLEEAPYRYREEIFRLLEDFAGWCEKYGLHTVFNFHKAVGNYCDIEEKVQLLDDPELQKRFIALWLETERRFAGFPEVAFELLNEVRDVDPEKWNRLAGDTIAAIRSLNPERIVIIGPTCWNNPPMLKHLRIFDDPRVVYTFHMYAPHEFTHQRGVLQAPQLFYNRDMPYPGDIERYRDFHRTVWGNGNAYAGYDRMDIRFMRDALQPAVDFAAEHPDKILWCGEFGTIRHARIEWRENWMRDVISILREHGIPYCVWNYLSTPNDGNRFSLVDDDSRRILSAELGRIIAGQA